MASRRGYLSQSELSQFADITITDATEADDQISMAEEQIDAYVGPQEKFFDRKLNGLVAAGGSTSFTLQIDQQNNMQAEYLKGCFVEIIGGTSAGDIRKITHQTLTGVVTVEEAFTSAVDTTSYYKIWQLGKFPRHRDVIYDSIYTQKYYKSIPEAVRRAVAAQVEYIINMGDKFFSTDASTRTSEHIGDYSYSKKGDGAGTAGEPLIAPKAQNILKGILNRKGTFV